MPAADRERQVELSASGSIVAIVSIPGQFYAASYDLLEQLFIPLLASAQEANDLFAIRVGDSKSALRAASYVAGELLRDTSFIPVRSLTTKAAHAYKIDLPANQFQAETRIFVEGTSSMFRVKVQGAIRGDKFIVVDPESKNTLFSFNRFEADKPEFFVRDFPFLAQESRKDPAMFGGAQSALVQGVVDLMLGVSVGGKTIMVRVQKSEDASSIEVKHSTTNKTLTNLPITALSNIGKLVETIAQHLSSNPADQTE
ncbi:MAG: hypothetical protein WAK89_00345 [Candidatus Sulfotelmatobacter sp.]